jgi:Tol biopolymer transport system component/DNA-binding winged helix-turn-helix (wHTH) protein
MDIPNNEKPVSDRLLIGECVVVLSSREVHVPGARRLRRLTPKRIGVLLVLVRKAGQVVTRDELFAEVWPDTMPTNDVLTQAVTHLRKAFTSGESGIDGAAYIETIAKTGYRLLAPVSWEGQGSIPAGRSPLSETALVHGAQAGATHAADVPRRSIRRRLRRQVLIAVGLALLASTVVMFWLLWTAPAVADPDVVNTRGTRVVGSPERPYRLITSTAAFETSPALSPDGSLVVFAKEEEGLSSLWIQSTGNTAAAPLVAPPAQASDRFPAWSPDGREIAFARFHPGDMCEVLLVSATGGSARRVARCDGTEMLSFDWSPDGRSLLFGSMTGSQASRGIRVLDLVSGRWSSLRYETGNDDFDYAPRYSPDGKRIGFVRNPQVGDLWVMDADGRNARRVTEDAAEIRGWSWLGATELVFGRRVDSESRLYRLDVTTGLLRDLGVDDADSPSVSRQGRSLAFKRDHPRYALFRFPLGEQGGKPQRLFASSGRDGQPMVSPDGKRLAFTSNRSGTFALWWGRLDDPDSLQVIEGFRPEARQPMDWSADGHSLLVAGRDGEGMPGIYEVTPEEGHWKKLPVPVHEPLQAIYGSQPGSVLVLERDTDDRMRLTLFDRRQQPWRRLASMEGVSQVRLDRAGDRVLFTRLAHAGLWQVGPTLAQSSIRLLSTEAPTRWRYRTWAVTGTGHVHYLHIAPDCASQLTAIEQPDRSLCLDARRYGSRNGLSMAPDGSAVYVALAIADGTDIGLMPVPEPAARPSIGVAKWLPWLRKPLS